ncbi:MAG: tetratricopeptide repeat protein [Ignavibacteria bacterium]|nr:tetratricopeptide repeat protein [Ignavibacteria bacterium]
MLKKTLILFITVTALHFSQTSIDSIYKSTSSFEDSARARILLDETWKRRSNEPLIAIQLGKEALKIYKSLGNKEGIARANNYIGIVYTNIGAIEVAFEFYKEALKSAEEADSQDQIAYSYNNLGEIFRTKNDVVNATEYIQRAIQIFDSIKDKRGLAYCFVNLGRLYNAQDDFKKGLEFFEKARIIAVELNLEDMHGRILLSIARIAQRNGDYDKAEKTFFTLETLYKQTDYLKGIAGVWRGLGELSYNKKNYKEALDYLLKAFELNKKIYDVEGEINSLNGLARVYLELNNIKTGERYLSLALQKARNINSSSLIANTYKTYYELYKLSGRLDSALLYHEKYYTLKDSIVTKEEIIKMGELESLIKIEKAEKEKEIIQKELENQTKQRNYLIIIAILSVILAIILLIRYFDKKKISEELKSINIVKDKFFRIIAHDLREPFSATFTALGLLKDQYDDLSESEKKEAIAMIGGLIKKDFDLLENLLLWAKNQRNEIAFKPNILKLKPIIAKIIQLIETNLDRKNISVHNELDEGFEIFADDQMLNTILRNIIFNAVKFTNPNGTIKINGEVSTEYCIIKISDNGVGMDKDTIKDLFALDKKTVSKGTAGESGSGLGMILVKEFIDRHKGTISIESEPGAGTTVIISFPQKS